MSLLESFLTTPMAAALGWSLLHSLWEGAIIAAALAAVLAASRSPRLRYASACAAMLAMIASLSLTIVRTTPDSLRLAQPLRPLAPSVWNVETLVSTTNTWNLSLDALTPWLAAFWVAGVLLFYLRHVAGLVSVQRLRQRGVCCAPERWQRPLLRLHARMRISRPVLLLESCLAETPMVIGHLRPVILMPVGVVAGLPAAQIEAILIHELAHIRRYDYLINLLQQLVEGLLFYHPAVWWITRVIRNERESCCDDAVVSIHGDAHEYARALAALEQKRFAGRQAAVAATGGSLVTRIRRLLYPKRSNGAWTPLFAALTLMATILIATAAWQSQPAIAAPPQSDRTQTSPYLKWLNEDVVYIIADEERAAFEKLTTDEERQKFIEQFWQRRDPKTSTPQNEMKEEHYRRISYANGRFSTQDKAGWQTDRGRVYIQWGPPDEIESHPSGGVNSPPFEAWRYPWLEGLGANVILTFRDPSRTGNYELVPPIIRAK